ncbi:MAG TPA: DUF2794 domain-containing protein [Stellaceae bacterium]|jgi:hypothetical protein|nr:DUF2794 domain-containing protein [Stellaceae bacterium]
MSGKSATIFPLKDYRAKRQTLYFSRAELNQLLSIYSRNVMRGVWRDYAIDHRDGLALFSVFRHTQEGAAYTIAKSSSGGSPEYTVLCGRQRLRVARSLPEALDFFRPDLTLVPAV